jgi:2-keto-4-pentenoate hydratase
MDKTFEAAKAIATARRARKPLAPLDPAIAPRDEADGYRIQDAVHAVLAPDTGPLVGYKIGCTSAVMQRYLGIPHPCGGGVFARGVHASGVSLRHGDYVRVGVECEIAVRLGNDLAGTGATFTADNVATPTGARSARQPWWRMIFLPPDACSAPRCRGRPRRICSVLPASR